MKKNIGPKLALYPAPVTVVGTLKEDAKPNWILIAHMGILSQNKLSLSIHASHYSTALIRKTSKLSVNIVDEAMLPAADYTGIVSANKTDKSAVFDYEMGANGTPIVNASPLAMECEVFDVYEADGYVNFFCTIVNTYVEDEMLDKKGQINYERLKPVLFEMPTHKYLATGKVLGDAVKMGRPFKGESPPAVRFTIAVMLQASL